MTLMGVLVGTLIVGWGVVLATLIGCLIDMWIDTE